MEVSMLFNKAMQHKAKLENTLIDYNDTLSKIDKCQKDLLILNEMLKTTTIAHEYLEALIKEESLKFVRKIKDILDYGVKSIFFDEEYSIDIRNNEDKTTIHLITTDEEGNKISPDIKDCGGGIRTVVGIMLQLYFIFHYKSERIIFIDEGFTQVSSIYIPYLMGLLQEMSEKNGLKIMLITHDTRFMSYADKVYEIIEGKSVLKKTKTPNIEVKVGDVSNVNSPRDEPNSSNIDN
jgi:DNA repair exonuclease SbcCD ATPase subunit